MKSFWREWPRIRRRLEAAPKRLFLLDFDGTLVGIARTPEAVRLRASTRRCLAAAARRKRNVVVLMSGRPVEGLREFVRVPGIAYVGNHGLEMRGKGLAPPLAPRRARELRFAMRALAGKLRADLRYLSGVIVEDKGLSVSVHFRNLPRQQRPEFMEVVRFFRSRGGPFRWRQGKKVWEALPKLRWNKGFAALCLLKRLRGALPVAIGDDRTDEDMFRAVGRLGVTVRVGRSKTSRARYYVKSQKEVDTLLEELTR